jgi:hypothetical protein
MLQRIIFMYAALFMFAAHSFSQSDAPQDEAPSVSESEADRTYVYRANQSGDQFIRFSLMVNFPLRPAIPQVSVGMAGDLGYMVFLNSALAIGGAASFGYHVTIGNNTFTFVPVVFKLMYQPVFRKFEFPVTIGVGGCFETYMNRTYFGLIINPELAAFFRINSEWSLGLFSSLLYMPQWYTNKDDNYDGFIITAGIGVRYHL